jgi:hypothetical protein
MKRKLLNVLLKGKIILIEKQQTQWIVAVYFLKGVFGMYGNE